MKGRINIKNDAGLGRVKIDIEGIIGLPEEMQFQETGNRVSTYGTLKGLMERVAATGAGEILVDIRSTGGSVGDALFIYDTLRESGAEVTTRCYGYVASAATIIAQAASPGKREVSETCLYLVHNSSCETEGNSMEMESAGEMLKKTDERIAGIYARSSGRNAAQYAALMAENGGRGRWLSPQEVLGYGLADKVIAGNSPGRRERRLVKNLGLPDLPVRSGLAGAVRTVADRIREYLKGDVRDTFDPAGGESVREDGHKDVGFSAGVVPAGLRPVEISENERDCIREAGAGYGQREDSESGSEMGMEDNCGGGRETETVIGNVADGGTLGLDIDITKKKRTHNRLREEDGKAGSISGCAARKSGRVKEEIAGETGKPKARKAKAVQTDAGKVAGIEKVYEAKSGAGVKPEAGAGTANGDRNSIVPEEVNSERTIADTGNFEAGHGRCESGSASKSKNRDQGSHIKERHGAGGTEKKDNNGRETGAGVKSKGQVQDKRSYPKGTKPREEPGKGKLACSGEQQVNGCGEKVNRSGKKGAQVIGGKSISGQFEKPGEEVSHPLESGETDTNAGKEMKTGNAGKTESVARKDTQTGKTGKKDSVTAKDAQPEKIESGMRKNSKSGKSRESAGKIGGEEHKRAIKKKLTGESKGAERKISAVTGNAGTVGEATLSDVKNKAEKEKEDIRKNILPSQTKPKEDPGMNGKKLSPNQQAYIEDLKRIKTV
ncbi:MAG: Clp protease ClpP [Alistipes sp.]|nr:Clp protease ClpP [Alistipes sp.]